MSHLLVHLFLELLYRRKHRIYLHVLDSILCYLTFQNHALFLILFLDCDAFFFEIFYDHGDAIVRVLVHEDVEDPGFAILYATPVHSDLIVGRQTVVNFLQRGKAAPCLQFGHIFDFSVCLKHH